MVTSQEADSKSAGMVRRLKCRDAEAMAELYDTYGRVAYTVILRLVRDPGVAEDLTQEAFLRAWTSIYGYDDSRGGLTAWIVAIARNRAIDYLRSSNFRLRHQAVTLETAGEESLTVEPEDGIENIDRTRALGRALTGLSSNQRLLLTLSFREGLSHREIAERIRQPLGTVKTRIRTALMSMREQLQSA